MLRTLQLQEDNKKRMDEEVKRKEEEVRVLAVQQEAERARAAKEVQLQNEKAFKKAEVARVRGNHTRLEKMRARVENKVGKLELGLGCSDLMIWSVLFCSVLFFSVLFCSVLF
jgi:hypothetical protein